MKLSILVTLLGMSANAIQIETVTATMGQLETTTETMGQAEGWGKALWKTWKKVQKVRDFFDE